MSVSVVILAAGKGTRTYSDLPKALHSIAGKPMVEYVIDSSRSLGAEPIHLVYGHIGERMKMVLKGDDLNWIEQCEQLGTGHAMFQAMPFLDDTDTVLMLYGDTPLIEVSTLSALIAAQPTNGIALLTVEQSNPAGYGRVVRDHKGHIQAIVEQKDASPEQLSITEVNTGIMVANGALWKRFLAQLTNNNIRGEYYVTEIVSLAAAAGYEINHVMASDAIEVAGVNNRAQQAALERAYQRKLASKLLSAGMALADPKRFDLRGSLNHGRDCFIDVNCVLEGQVILGDRVTIGPNCVLKDCVMGDDVEVKANSMIDGANLLERSSAGPFARLRPGAVLGRDSHIGNFVEVKEAQLGEGTKCGHLSYLGNTYVGARVNIGAGTVTCNYNGVSKFQTIIEDGAFIGSNSQLVAPVRVGENATVGAGSTITKNVPANTLTISRARQKSVSGWRRPVKKS